MSWRPVVVGLGLSAIGWTMILLTLLLEAV